jgi:hypothetical protein
MGRVAHDIRRFVSRKEHRPRVAQPDDVAQFTCPDTGKSGVVEPVSESHHGNNGLWLEGGAALDQVPRFGNVEGQQQKLKLGGELVFTSLAGNLHGEGQALFTEDAAQYCQCYLALVGSEAVK